MNRHLLATLVVLVTVGGVSAAHKDFEITINSGKHDRVNVPVCVHVTVPADLAKAHAHLKGPDDKVIFTQVTDPGLAAHDLKVATGEVVREVHFILPSLKPGETLKLRLSVDNLYKSYVGFEWKDTPGQFSELSYAGLPILRYVCPKFDDSTKENRDRTYKVFHHLYDLDGKKITNDGVVGLYPHHRGIFFAFNKVTYGDGKKCDVWHCTGDAYQSHEKTLAHEAGGVLGRHRVEIAWHGVGKEVFAREQRELTVYNVPGGRLVEFASKVSTTGGPVKLDGDPQHAGFHFRADKEVAEKSKDKTVFIRPDGVGEPGQKGTRNWDPKTMKGPVNMPWNAMSFDLGGKRYTVAYLDKPTNPKEARFSEREYGRIGSYFEYDLTEKKPLLVNYRLWLQEGQMTPEQVAEKSAAFVTPPEVTVK
jgi:hypothetical protein